MKSSVVDVHSLPVLPEIADRLLRMALDEEVTVARIAGLIEKDQALTARVLSLANSSYYRRSRQIGTVRDAVVLVGAEAVRTLVLGMSVLGVFPSRTDSPLDHRGFWRHCLASAMYAEAVMARVSPALAAKAFCAGLLHDIGKLVLDFAMPEEYARVLGAAADGLRSLEDVERETLGVTHADVGRDMLARWKLPEVYEETVWCHHAPVKIIDDDQHLISMAVAVANTLSHLTALGSSGNFFPAQVPAALLKRLAVDDAFLDGLIAEIPAGLERICAEIGIGKDPEGIFSLVNRAGMRLAEAAIRLHQKEAGREEATRKSGILLDLLRGLNSAVKVTDVLSRAAETLLGAGVVKGFLGGLVVNGAKLIFEQRTDVPPRFVRLAEADVATLARERGYSAGMSLPSGVFVYIDPEEAACGDDGDLVSSIVTSIASSLRRVQAESALSREQNLLREALKTTTRERQKVEELAELNRELIDASSVGLCLVDARLAVRVENPESARLRGLLGIAGENIGEEASRSMIESVRGMGTALKERSPMTAVAQADGRSVRITVQPVARASMILVILEDITSELEDQRRTLAYAKMSAVGSLAASMAHNMKSPLGAIHGFANIIREDIRQGRITVRRGDAEDQDLPDMLANIVAASENLIKIVNQLLSFTRKWESPEREVALDAFVEGAFQLVDAQAKSAQVTLVNEAEPVRAAMRADAVEQVVVNLLMNAINASPRGSKVVVRARESGGGIELAVVDFGIGMDDEQVKRIFDPLYSSWPMKTGMGLGLSLARQIVESMGGTISVASKLAQGSTFTVWIPRGEGAA